MGIIISSFRGCGKTYLQNTYGDKIVIKESIPSGDIDNTYVQNTLDLTDKSDIVFVPSTKEVRNALNEHNVDYDLFYPSKNRRLEFVENQARKRMKMQSIQEMDNNFDKWIDEIDSDESNNCFKHKLENRNEFIGNDSTIMNYINNIQESQKKK